MTSFDISINLFIRWIKGRWEKQGPNEGKIRPNIRSTKYGENERVFIMIVEKEIIRMSHVLVT